MPSKGVSSKGETLGTCPADDIPAWMAVETRVSFVDVLNPAELNKNEKRYWYDRFNTARINTPNNIT